ncbi:hypothetical protein BK126_03165 [Paenibacillus sp. FSL H7-0326]|nr:hypothetical protein BK126_03165 [Paenibacillus sp. FSL H7-0326]
MQKELRKAIQTLERFDAETDPKGNSRENVVVAIADFFKYDLNKTIDLLKTVLNEVETKKDHGGNHSL